MWADATRVCLAYGAAATADLPDVWLVQSRLPADWVNRLPLLRVSLAGGASALDSRFDWLARTVDADAYATDRSAAEAALDAFRAQLVGGAQTEHGRTNSPPDIVTVPFEFPSSDLPDGVHRVTAAFRAVFTA